MPKEDYLLKYLEKLSRVIAAMFGFRDKGFPEDAIRLADKTYKELLDFKLDELAVMPLERFIDLIRQKGYTSTYLETLARLAYETANSLELTENESFVQSFYLKTLHIYLIMNEKDKTFSFEREMIISELKEKTTT
ncbi:MAG: hypothetical protein WCG08_09280 [Paludibacter sp.]